MKNTSKFLFAFCFFAAFSMMSCEKAEIQKTNPDDVTQLGIGTDDCDDCPVFDCCCSVELIGGTTPATLDFCGTSGARISTTTCGPIGADLCLIEGFIWQTTLVNPGASKGIFCAEPGVPFCITGTSGAQIKITCQEGQLNPQFVFATLGTNRVYYTANNECELESCL